jgi:hypothetical protein
VRRQGAVKAKFQRVAHAVAEAMKHIPRAKFFWAFADAFGTVAAKEGAVIEEELQQVEIRCAQLTAEEKIVAQPRVEVFD